ncbi:hypothetical protein MASR1M8_00340 [Thermomonas brevis]
MQRPNYLKILVAFIPFLLSAVLSAAAWAAFGLAAYLGRPLAIQSGVLSAMTVVACASTFIYCLVAFACRRSRFWPVLAAASAGAAASALTLVTAYQLGVTYGVWAAIGLAMFYAGFALFLGSRARA